MDTFKSNDSLAKGRGVQFGEYPATKKVNKAQTNSAKSSNNPTQEINAEFGEYQKTTNEIAMDYDNNPSGGDILQATSSGVTLGNFGAITTKVTDFNTQYGTSFDSMDVNPSNDFNLGEFQASDYATNNLGELGVDILQQTSSAENFVDSNAFAKNAPNTNKDNTQNFDFSAYQSNDITSENLANILVDTNNTDFDYNEYQVSQNEPDPNQILHQSIEPGFETNSTTDAGAFQTNTQLNNINAKTENYQDFDFGEYQKTEVTGDIKSNIQNVENQTNGPILDTIPEFDTNEFGISELVDTKTYQTASKDVKDYSANEFIDTAYYQTSQPVISKPSHIQKIDSIALNPSQTVVKSGATLQKIDTAEYKKSEPNISSAVFSTSTPKYDTISGFDATSFGTTTTTKTTKTTTTTTTKTSSPAMDVTDYPVTKPNTKATSDLQINTANNYQEFKPVVDTNSTIDTNALTTNSPEFDIDALLANQPALDNYDFNTTSYQTTNQEFTSSGFDFSDITLPTQTTIVKQKPLPVQTQTTTIINKPTPLPVQTTTTIIKQAPLPTKTTIINSPPLPVQTQTTVIKSKPITTQTPLPVQTTTTVIKQAPSPIQDTGYTLGNIESSPDFNIDEILKNYQTSTNLQQGRDSTILDEFFSSPQSFKNNTPQPTAIPSITTQVKQVKVPEYTPPIPVTIPEPIFPTTLDTGATFGEYKKSSNIEEIQTAFSPSFDLFNLNQGLPETIPPNQGLPETIPLNLPETIPPNQGFQETIPLNLPETIPPNQELPETIPSNIKTVITTIPKVEQQIINPEKIYLAPQNNIQVPQTITYEQKSFVPQPQLVGTQTAQYTQKSYVPPPQLVEVTKRASFSVPKTMTYAQKPFVPPTQIVATQMTTPVSVPKTIPYAQTSFVPSPNIRRVVVPQTIPYAQKSFVPPPAPVVTAPATTRVVVPQTIPYAQKSFVPPPAPVVTAPATTRVVVPQTIPYAQKSFVPPPAPVVTAPATTRVVVPQTIPYAQKSFVPPPAPVVTAPATTRLAVPQTIPYAQKSVLPYQTSSNIVVPKTIPYTQKSIVVRQPLPVAQIPVTTPVATTLPVQPPATTTPVPIVQPQIVPRPVPVAPSVIGAQNVVNSTLPVPTVTALPAVQSVAAPQPAPQIIRPVAPMVMNRPGVYNASTYRVGFSRMNPHPGLISGYRTNNIASVGTVGNMNLPGQYTTRTYNARKL